MNSLDSWTNLNPLAERKASPLFASEVSKLRARVMQHMRPWYQQQVYGKSPLSDYQFFCILQNMFDALSATQENLQKLVLMFPPEYSIIDATNAHLSGVEYDPSTYKQDSENGNCNQSP